MVTIWDFLTYLWNSAADFLNYRIDMLGLDFTLWQVCIGVAVVDLLLYAIFRCLE